MNILKFILGCVVALGLYGDSPVALQKTAAFKGWGPTDFVTVWTVGAGDTITLPTPTQSGITYNYNVQWGDNLVDYNVTTANKTHTYAAAGTYTNIITGTLQKWNFNNAGSKLKIVKILQFGNTGFKDLSYAFQNCTGLTGSIPSLSANTQLTALYAAFYGCTGLTGSIPSLTANTQLTTLDHAFYGCSGLTGSIPSLSSNTQLTSLYYAFQNCTGLTGSIPSLSANTQLTTLAYAFQNCTGLTGSIPSLSANTQLTSLYAAFYNCTGLTGSIPSLSANTQLATLYTAFYYCNGLTGSIPSLSANTQLTSLAYAFYGCSGLTANTNTVLGIFGAANMPNLTTANQCFYGCKWVIGNSSDFTNKTFAASFTYGTDPTNSTYRMFYGQTNLTDWLTVGADWK